MNGGADLGGMMGFGPVIEDLNAPHFHAEWEARILGMVVALGACGQWNLDQSRFARESLPPGQYLTASYYQIWLEGVSKLMQARGMVTPDELQSGIAHTPPVAVKAKLTADRVEAVLNAGGPVDRPAETPPLFAVGDMVRTPNIHPEGHTRLPRYARAKTGQITRILGHHVFPDSNAKGEGEAPTWLYQVRFTARELWGPDRSARDAVTLDLWQPYLQALT